MLDEGDRVRDYTLKKFLGRGQFGEVWLAEKTIELADEGIPFALKFLTNQSNQGINTEGIKNEVSTWIKAGNHYNIVPVYDGFIHGRFLVIVSEYIDGGSLRDWLESNNKKAPSLEKAIEMIRAILSGLAHLHSRKIIHRDLKPENILLKDGVPKITDFGVSRMVETFSPNAALHQTRGAGSPLYMPPEAFTEGHPMPQLDTWSAGVLFYELLSGGFPFSANNLFALISEIATKDPKPLPSDVPQELRELVSKALVKDMAQRFQTSVIMLEALEKARTELQQSKNNILQTISNEVWLERERQRREEEEEARKQREAEEVRRLQEAEPKLKWAEFLKGLENFNNEQEEERQRQQALADKRQEEEARKQREAEEARRLQEAESKLKQEEAQKEKARKEKLKRLQRGEARRATRKKLAWAGIIAIAMLGIVFGIIYQFWPSFSTYYNNGYECKEKKDYDCAIDNFNKAIELNPQSANAYHSRGAVYNDYKNNYDQALSDFNKAIELNPQFTEAYVGRGLAYFRKNNYDQALKEYNKAIELDPQFADAYHDRGVVYHNQNNYDQAISDYNKALELDPKYELAYYNRALIYYNKSNYAQALSDFNKAIELNPENANAYNNRRLVYEKLGQTDKAQADRQKYEELSKKK